MISRTIWRSAWLSLVGLSLWAFPAAAQEWAITGFTSDIQIQSSTSIDVVETIDVNFDVQKHGIFRNIPFRYEGSDGERVTVPIDIQRVERNGSREPFDESISGDDVVLKIGDPDETVIGPQTYTIEYRVRVAVNFFEDHDELYWNVTGHEWEVDVQNVEATVQLPEAVPAEDLQIACYTGVIGTRGSDCVGSVSDGSATFTADEPLTIVFGWPKGVTTQPTDFESTRTQGDRQGAFPWTLIDSPWRVFGNLLLPILALIGLLWWWRVYGRDPKSKGTVVAQYEPPDDLTAGEVGVIIDEYANHQDIVATIIGLAVAGYLEITEVKEKKIFKDSVDYQLTKKTPAKPKQLRSHESRLYDALFDSGDEVMISDLRGKLYQEIQKAEDDLYLLTVEKKYFFRNPAKVRQLFFGLGLTVLFLGIWAAFSGVFSFFLIGPLMMGFARTMPKRTPKGVQAQWHIRGLKLFLEKAEKYRLQWQEREHIFEELLPYAMALGVAEKWSKTFEGIKQQPPGWYHGTPGSTFNTVMFWSAISSFNTATTRSFSPPAASGGSGLSGGGGFSGGGFGGGGGGSW